MNRIDCRYPGNILKRCHRLDTDCSMLRLGSAVLSRLCESDRDDDPRRHRATRSRLCRDRSRRQRGTALPPDIEPPQTWGGRHPTARMARADGHPRRSVRSDAYCCSARLPGRRHWTTDAATKPATDDSVGRSATIGKSPSKGWRRTAPLPLEGSSCLRSYGGVGSSGG